MPVDPYASIAQPQVRTGATATPQGNYASQGVSNPPNGGQITDVDNPEPNDPYASIVTKRPQPGLLQRVGMAIAGNTDNIPNPNNNFGIGLTNYVHGAERAIGQMVAHPLESAESMLTPFSAGPGGPGTSLYSSRPLQQNVELFQQAQKEPAGTAGELSAPFIFGGAGFDEFPGKVIDGASALREAAMGDPDAAALRGLHVSPQSKFALQTLEDAGAARPFLQGDEPISGLKDLQSRIPQAKAEVWEPRQNALSRIGGQAVKGPDGKMTTVQDLENRRLELSAQLRTLKKGGPDAMALAQQKGLTQAALMREESQINFILDRQFQRAGIDSQAIRQTYGQLSRIGAKVKGKTTTGEPTQPFGFARLGDVDIKKPFSNFGLLKNAGRDVAAGRYWSQRPTDLNIREAFRPSAAGPMPNFTVPVAAPPQIAGFLSNHTGGPFELPYVPEMSADEQLAALMHYLRNGSPPKGLPAKASAIRLSAGND